MASFPKNTSASDLRILGPVRGGDKPGIDSIMHGKRLGTAGKKLLHLQRKRSEAAIIADHI